MTPARKTTAKKRPRKTAAKRPRKTAGKSARKPTRKTARKSTRKTARKRIARKDVIVRMYDVGFGDCFLVLIPGARKTRKILVDCGSVKAGANPMKAVVAQLMSDVTDADGVARIDLVIGTHRHKDHVSGFADAAWSSVEVGEVWMPWTEHPTDPRARHIRETQAGLALQLQAFALRVKSAVSEQLDLIAVNALSNEAAMDTLHNGFAGQAERKFLPIGDALREEVKPAGIPEAMFYVLGPSRSEEVIREMDPPAGKSYLRLRTAESLGTSARLQPFGDEWVTERVPTELTLEPRLLERLHKVGEGLEGALGAALDKAVNGTSLMLVMKVGRTYLLFPGDAQWGTWRSVLEDSDARRLIEKATFLKVGHHGSHNATPKEYVDSIFPNNCWAMTSVTPVKQWPKIPREPLVEELQKKTNRFVRSDMPPQTTDFQVTPFYTEARVKIE